MDINNKQNKDFNIDFGGPLSIGKEVDGRAKIKYFNQIVRIVNKLSEWPKLYDKMIFKNKSVEKRIFLNDNINRNKRKAILNNMSIVGIIKCIDGVLGFADTKPSKLLSNGKLGYDENKKVSKKIFKSENLLVCTSGLVTVNGVWLDEIIEPILKKQEDKYDFIRNFSIKLLTQSVDGRYLFILHDMNCKGLIDSLIFENRNFNPQISTISETGFIEGDEFYRQRYGNFLIEVYNRRMPTISEAKKMILEFHSKVYEEAENSLEYNSVSKDLTFEEIIY